ncbi:sugar ABC transporter substrate-binding protein [Peribacillus sp. NPDC058002]|uniref:sugar ABC transporter substrate-binding protein n=1 Tax=Peribacillus sp. NPDC058002 TaxID=3346301 RepID=UPI0036DC7FC3
MKTKVFFRSSLIFLVIFMFLMIIGCSQNESTTSVNPDKQATLDYHGQKITTQEVFKIGEIPDVGIVHTEKGGYKIALTIPSLEFKVFKIMKDAIEIQAHSDGNELEFVNAEGDINKQLAAVDTFITQKVDLVIFCAVDPTSERIALNKLRAAGIDVVALDRPFDDENIRTVAGFDEGSGINAAKVISEKLGGQGKVAQVIGQLGVPHTYDSERGFETELKNNTGLEQVAKQPGDYQRDKSFTVTKDIISAHPKGKLDAIFAHNANQALGVMAAVEGAGRLQDPIYIVGGDLEDEAISAIEQGKMLGTNDRNPMAIGATAYQMSAAILNGNEEIPYAVLIPPVMFTKENLDQINEPFYKLEVSKKLKFETYKDFAPRLKIH